VDIFIIPLLIVALYIGGGFLDEYFETSWFIGGILPYMGFYTYAENGSEFKSFLTAWAWHGIHWFSTIREEEE